MEQFYRSLILDLRDGTTFCGIIYCMYWIREKQIVPLYIGKAERYGNNGRLSANLTNPAFGRWGYSKYYHLGDLALGLQSGRKTLIVRLIYGYAPKRFSVHRCGHKKISVPAAHVRTSQPLKDV
jgi:hypothetical protein